jgi:hypothetical protein
MLFVSVSSFLFSPAHEESCSRSPAAYPDLEERRFLPSIDPAGGAGRQEAIIRESSKKGGQTSADSDRDSACPRKWLAFSAVSLASNEVPYRPSQQHSNSNGVSERGVGREEVGLVPFPIAVGTAPPPERQFFLLSPAPVSPNSDQWSDSPPNKKRIDRPSRSRDSRKRPLPPQRLRSLPERPAGPKRGERSHREALPFGRRAGSGFQLRVRGWHWLLSPKPE